MANCIILSGGTWTPEAQPKIQRSLGPYRIATALEESGYSVFVLDYIIHLSIDEIKKVLDLHLSEETIWVGFSSTFFWSNNSSSFNQSSTEKMYYTKLSVIDEIVSYIKEKSSAKILYGGAKAPFFLSDKNIDYYVIGYADNSTVELTKHLSTGSEIEMKSHIIDGKETYIVESSSFEEPKMNCIKTSWKNRNVLPKEGLPLELARGCIFKCKFCSYPLLGKDKGTYLRDPNEIRDELIEMWELYGTESYYITDDTFNDDNDKIEALHRVFTSLPFKPKFSAYLRVDLINKYPHQADLLSEMGLIGTYFGIETLQAESAVSIGKGLKPNKVKDRLYWLREQWKNKVNIGAGFILGLPYDTDEYFDELIDWCMEDDNPIQHTSFYPLFLFPRPKGHNLASYTSEFSLNPEVYGYEFNDKTNFMNWSLPMQKLDYKKCQLISNEFSSIIYSKNKVSEFQMITYMNSGISQEDLYKLTFDQLYKKYDTLNLNLNKLNEYKRMIGAIL
jgi:hypothetical protein